MLALRDSLRSPFLPVLCPCRNREIPFSRLNSRRRSQSFKRWRWRWRWRCRSRPSSKTEILKAQKFLVSNELDYESSSSSVAASAENEPSQMASTFTGYRDDPMVDKLRTQLGVIHPIPSPPINRNIVGFFVFFFFVGVIFDKLWTSRKRESSDRNARPETWPQVPTSFSLFLEKDLQRKESVEWVNMVLGKLWKVYRGGIENWLIGLLQPVIDNLKKPDYVQRVEIKQFSLGEEPLSVRNVERRTSRRVNDLQWFGI